MAELNQVEYPSDADLHPFSQPTAANRPTCLLSLHWDRKESATFLVSRASRSCFLVFNRWRSNAFLNSSFTYTTSILPFNRTRSFQACQLTFQIKVKFGDVHSICHIRMETLLKNLLVTTFL
jgi:hypothetical protein